MHLSDLTLIVGDFLDGNPKGSRRVDLVNLLTSPEQFKLGVARYAVRQPRRDPRLNRRPIGDDKRLALGGQQRRTKHTLQHVSDALAVLRHNSMTAHHRLTHLVGLIGALAGKIVNLSTVG